MKYSDRVVLGLFPRAIVKLPDVASCYANGWVLDLSWPISRHFGDVMMVYPRGGSPLASGRPRRVDEETRVLEAAE